MAHFPFFVDISGKPGLIIGGGKIALRKIEKLLPYGPSLTICAPDFLPELQALAALSSSPAIFTKASASDAAAISTAETAAAPTLQLLHRPFGEDLLEPAPVFVIAATDDRALNRRIATLCKEKSIPVNAVDDKDACSFIFPALVTDGDLSIGISTGGASPSAAVWLKQQISTLIPDGFASLLENLAALRPQVKDSIPDEAARASCLQNAFRAALSGSASGFVSSASNSAVSGSAASDSDSAASPSNAVTETVPCGKVYLVGAGCGEADLITVRGAKLLQSCDAVVYDDLIDSELLELVPPYAEQLYMGKRRGHHSAPQSEINETLIRLARSGKIVVRLKGGDPFVFGRGGEELLALQAAGIPFETVPGISSAIAIPGAAGIPVTHRGLSRSLHIVTAHTAASSAPAAGCTANDQTAGTPSPVTATELPEELPLLAQLSGTLVFLMGLSKLEALTEELMAAGKSPSTPAAVLSGGNSPHPATVRGTLSDIASKTRAAGVQAPAVILVGEVAALDLR
ncbi:MAG: uroporphyrinogen-III C-methyltransferase [Clostridiales bacterium]|nr:uroporphyrinogen-III C-methyltransferase [Clostridiales bacterium]